MKLKDIVEINPKVNLLKGVVYPFVAMQDITPNNRYVYSTELKEYQGGGSKFEKNDILFARITPCLENGKINQFKGANLSFGSTEFIVFRAKNKISNSAYIFYLVCSEIIRKPAEKSMYGASGRQRADLATIKNLDIPKYSLETQHKIAAILSAYDDLIENNTRRIKLLEEMAHMLYREWFVHFRFPGHEKVKFVESELGRIPEGWEVRQLNQVCTFRYGYTAKATSKNTGYNFLRITDIVPHIIDWDTVPYCEISNKDIHKFIIEKGDIVVARTGANVGYAKCIDKHHPNTVFASYLVRLRVNDLSNSCYIRLIVESDEYKNFIKGNCSGAAQPQANANILTSYPVIIPPINIQNSFQEIVGVFFSQRATLQKKNQLLRQTRDLLLPKLISGEIDVSNLDIKGTESFTETSDNACSTP